MGNKRKFKSLATFKTELDYTSNLLIGLLATIKVLDKLTSIPNFPYLNPRSEKDKKVLVFDEKRINSIYELGFIRAFASFESFMYDFLRELYLKYPESLPKDRKIEIEYILDWDTKSSIKSFLIDYVSIENSYDLAIWEKTLEKSFGITVFENKDERDDFFYLNLYRNTLLHSGGKYNSKVLRDHVRYFGNLKPEPGQKNKFEVGALNIDNNEMYHWALNVFRTLITRFEAKCAEH